MIIFTTKENVQREVIRYVEEDENELFKGHDLRSPLSKTGTILRALANAVFLFIDKNLLAFQNALHPSTMEEEDLHLSLNDLGDEWKEATSAKHRIRIGSSVQPVYKVPIPVGYVVATTDRKIRFQTLQEGLLPALVPMDSNGKYTIELICECLTPGLEGNVTPNAITEHIDYIPEIDVVYNPDTIPYFGGRDRERLATVRERLRQIQIGATSQEWTADWYVLIALSFTYVEKVVFKSSKSLGIPGVVKLLLLGPDGSALSPAQLTEVSEHFNSEALNPGGAAHVIAENAGAIPINKIFSLYFASADSIPTPAALQTLVDTFFAELKDQQSFIVNSFKSLLLQFPDAVSCDVDNDTDILVGSGQIAYKGSAFDVIMAVY